MGVAGRYAYIPGHRGGLQILDVSDPSNITLVATVAIPAVNSIASITTEEGYLYISGGYTGFWILHTFAGRGDLPEV
jgi:hypothetical protein